MEEDETNHEGKSFNPYEDLVRSQAPDAMCQRFAVKDLSVPTVDEMAMILDAIDGHLGENRIVYVHCWGGVGRTGTVVACWMLRQGMAMAEDVLGKLKLLRRQDQERGHRESPETAGQRDFIRVWCNTSDSSVPAPVAPTESTNDDFQPSPAAAAALRELLDRYQYMNGFKDGPFGKNQLTATESALFAATYEIQRLALAMNGDEYTTGSRSYGICSVTESCGAWCWRAEGPTGVRNERDHSGVYDLTVEVPSIRLIEIGTRLTGIGS